MYDSLRTLSLSEVKELIKGNWFNSADPEKPYMPLYLLEIDTIQIGYCRNGDNKFWVSYLFSQSPIEISVSDIKILIKKHTTCKAFI